MVSGITKSARHTPTPVPLSDWIRFLDIVFPRGRDSTVMFDGLLR
jgi:hypothetical protein